MSSITLQRPGVFRILCSILSGVTPWIKRPVNNDLINPFPGTFNSFSGITKLIFVVPRFNRKYIQPITSTPLDKLYNFSTFLRLITRMDSIFFVDLEENRRYRRQKESKRRRFYPDSSTPRLSSLLLPSQIYDPHNLGNSNVNGKFRKLQKMSSFVKSRSLLS